MEYQEEYYTDSDYSDDLQSPDDIYQYWSNAVPEGHCARDNSYINNSKTYVNPDDVFCDFNNNINHRDISPEPNYYLKRERIHDRYYEKKDNTKKIKKTGLDQYVQKIFDKEFKSKKGVINTQQEIDPQIYFNYNTFNLCIGNQGTAKTATVMGEFIKLSQVKHDYHLIIFVSDTPDDHTRTVLSEYINVPMIKIPYNEAEEKFEQIVKLKEEYNAMVDGSKEKDPRILSALHIDDFKRKRLHTILFFDDAAGIFDKNSKSKFRKWFCEIRHTNTTVFCNVQAWGHISAELKSQITNVFLFGGFSRERLQYIWKQIPNSLEFEEFYNKYITLLRYQKMIINTRTREIKII